MIFVRFLLNIAWLAALAVFVLHRAADADLPWALLPAALVLALGEVLYYRVAAARRRP